MVHFLCVVSEPLFCLGDTEEWPLFILTTVSDLHFTFFFLNQLTSMCLSSK